MVKYSKVAQVYNDGNPMPDWVFQRLRDAGIDFTVAQCETRGDLARAAGDADIVWMYAGSRILMGDNLLELGRCGAILRSGSGTDNVDVARATELGIIVANTPYVTTSSVSDHTISLLFSLVRHITRYDRMVRDGVWDFRALRPYRRFEGATLGLVGFGRIPQAVARKVSGFDMALLAFDPFVSAEKMAPLGVRKAELDELLAASDYVSLHCPLTSQTRHLIGERELRLMKPTALVVNTSRGPVVDEPALIRALQEGWIAGAALDVLEKEPPAPDNPLLTMENVVLTPHFGGMSDNPEDFAAVSVETLIDLAEGRWPRSIVDPTVAPRWGTLEPSREMAPA